MVRNTTVLLIACLGIADAQAPVFRMETRVVQVPVSVTLGNGRNVEDLRARDFRLLDDGVPQKIALDRFDTGVAPISLGIAIQTAGISTPALAKIRRIGGMIQPLVIGSRGEAAVVTFDSEVKWLQDFTPDSGKIQDAVKSLAAHSDAQARMFDAIVEVADRMKQRSGRKVLLLISESRDRGSKAGFEQAVEAVQREGIEVFGAHYSAYATAMLAKPADLPDTTSTPTTSVAGPPGPPTVGILGIFTELARLGKTNAIQALTQATGGADFPFLKARGIEKAIEKLGAEVHSQYFLSFMQRADTARPGMHRIDVSVPERGDLRLRFRQGYWVE